MQSGTCGRTRAELPDHLEKADLMQYTRTSSPRAKAPEKASGHVCRRARKPAYTPPESRPTVSKPFGQQSGVHIRQYAARHFSRSTCVASPCSAHMDQWRSGIAGMERRKVGRRRHKYAVPAEWRDGPPARADQTGQASGDPPAHCAFHLQRHSRQGLRGLSCTLQCRRPL